MKTRQELSAMTLVELRNFAKSLGIKGANLFKEEVLVKKILEIQGEPEDAEETQETQENEGVEETEEYEEDDEVEEAPLPEKKMTPIKEDRHGKTLEQGDRVGCNINGRWYEGVVDGFKVLDGETWVFATLTQFGKQRQFLTTHVELLKKGQSLPEPDVKEMTNLASASEEDLVGEPHRVVDKLEKASKVKKEKEPNGKQEPTKKGVAPIEPVKGVKYQKIEDVPDFGIKKGDKVSFITRKGEKVIGTYINTTWDKQSNSPYSYIKGEDNKVYSKKPGTLTKLV